MSLKSRIKKRWDKFRGSAWAGLLPGGFALWGKKPKADAYGNTEAPMDPMRGVEKGAGSGVVEIETRKKGQDIYAK